MSTESSVAVTPRRPVGRSVLGFLRDLPLIILVAVFSVAVIISVGAVAPHLDLALVIAAVVAGGLISAVAVHPPLAAYLLLFVTPLIAGIDRGSVIPVLRPSEAVALLAGMGLGLRGVLDARGTGFVLPKLRTADVTILLLAITSSIVPILWILLRGMRPDMDDFLYSLTIWKLYAVYVIFRCSVRTAAQVRIALFVAMVSAAIVAVIAVLQAVELFGVAQFLQRYYAPYGVTSEVANNRGGATLSLPVAVADLLVFNITVAFGLLIRGVTDRERKFLIGVSLLFIMGVLSSGELSGLIALLIAAVTIAWITRRGRVILRMVPVLLASLVLLRPVLEQRLSDIDPNSGFPVSWLGRLDNLHTFFWPRLFSGFNFVLGIRPSARVATPKFASGWVWIESGYTWLLWAGGIPLLLAYLYFTSENIRVGLPRARHRPDAVGAASLAVVVALIVIAVCMMLDPHLTYRGSADFLFALLALAGLRTPIAAKPSDATSPRGRPTPVRTPTSQRGGVG